MATTEIYFTGRSGASWRYWTDQPLGRRGNFGAVYAAEGRNGIPMAVKVVEKRRPYSILDNRLLQREVEIGQRVTASGAEMLLPVVDAAETSDSLLLVMVRADGALDDKLRVIRLEEPEVVSVMIDLAVGLEELRTIRIIHRDLKPANVLLHKGRWKLADFGIARDEEIGTQDQTFIGWGSHPYMAPELWKSEAPTVKTDLYALGCLAYELMAGMPPYPGDREAARKGHLNSTLPEVPVTNSLLKNLIVSLIAKRPEDRPQDAQAVLERLHAASSRLSSAQANIVSRLAKRAEEESREYNQKASRQAVHRAAAEERRRLITQARVDLREIVKDAFERLRMVVPDAKFEQREGGFERPGTRHTIMYVTAWPAILYIESSAYEGSLPFPSLSNAIVTVGSIGIPRGGIRPGAGIKRISRIPYRSDEPDDVCLAGLVCEKVGDRLQWQAYRFGFRKLNGLERYILKHFSYRLAEPDMSDSTVTKLTAEAVLEMFAEVLDFSHAETRQ